MHAMADQNPHPNAKRASIGAITASAMVAAAIIVTLVSVPVGGGGALPCQLLSKRVDAALQQNFNNLPLLWAAIYEGQYQRDRYELLRKLRRENGFRCLADLATVSLSGDLRRR